MSQTRIIIAGAGPVGVVLALALAQHGYAVTLLEADAIIDDNPRAATTHPSTFEMIARVGLIDQFIKEGLVARYFQFWDKPTRTRIVQFDHELLRDETPYPFVVQTEQHKLARMGIERLKTFADVEVRFSTRVTGVTQDAEGATVTAEGPNGLESHRIRLSPSKRMNRYSTATRAAGARVTSNPCRNKPRARNPCQVLLCDSFATQQALS